MTEKKQRPLKARKGVDILDLNKELEELKLKMTPLNTAKFIAGTVISLGATAAVFALMKGGLAGSKGVTKLLMKLGIFVLACKAGDVAEEYFKETFTEAQEAFSDAKKVSEEKKDV